MRGCIRSYLILRERVQRFNADAEIQSLLADLRVEDRELEALCRSFSVDNAAALQAHAFDPAELADRRLNYQRLDQMTFELLAGVR